MKVLALLLCVAAAQAEAEAGHYWYAAAPVAVSAPESTFV